MATQSEKTPTNTFLKLNKNVRSMPDWVTEAHDRIGPKPPAPPPSPGASNGPSAKPPLLPPKTTNKSPEPDYEVIEFSGQQYSNEPPLNGAEKRSKTPDTKPKCTLCGSNNPWVRCDECAQQIFCASCDDMFHRHPKRKNHLRKALEVSRPPLPAKMLPGQPRPAPPVAPPRRSKRGNAATPLMQRKDQVSMVRASVPASPTPSDGSRNAAWPERGADAFAIRGMNLSNRPLPDTPKTPTTPSDDMLSSRSTTPRSVFDAIQRPPSVTLEKIKSKASATLDRMAQLQQRYRQQKEERERNRSGSVTDQRQAQSQQPQQQHFAADRTAHLAQRPTSSSVFNLNQLNRRPAPVEINSNQWPSNQQMLQAHSMAHLNWPHSNQRPQPNDWSNQFCPNQQLNRSNLSLNVGTGYLMAPQHPVSMYPTSPPSAAAAPPPPPVFMNTRGMMPNMYPYPYPGMPFMSPGIVAMPPPARSRGASRASSRLPSPTLSRRSLSLRNKKRSSYTETTPTDDEDSDQDDRRSLMSNRSGLSGVARQRRVPQGFLDDSESSHSYSLRSKMREQRHGSFVKPVANQNEWLPDRRASMSNARPSETGSVVSPLKSSRIYSDLDSEGSGTRALVQAKIQQKLDEEPSKRRSTRGRESSRAKQGTESTVVKKCAEVQAGRVRSTKESAQEEEQQQNNNNNNNKENLYPNNASSRPFDSREVSKERTKPKHHTDSAPNESEETCSEEADKKGKDESPPLGPPPGTPDHEWECEFCTFVNEPKVKICTICCKTPSKAPESLPPKTQPVAAAKAKPRDARGPTTRQAPETPSSNHADPRDHRVRTARNRQPTNSKDLAAPAQVLPTQPADLAAAKADPKKDSESFDDIWTTLEEDIQATAGAVIRKAESRIQQEVSTISCGTSPQRQLPPESEAGGREKITLQNDTNPAPQSISTQTYETLPLHHRKQEERYEDPNVVVLDNPRDLQESTATPAEPAPSAIMTGNNLQYLRDLALLQTERDRYRSSGDLRRIDISPMDYSPVPSLGRRQSSVAELLLLHRGPQQLGSYSPLPGLLNDPSSAYHEMKTLRDPETELYLLIKEAELYKFTSEELHIALKFCAYDTHPVQWLRENWFKLVQTVQNLATKYGQERAENTIGTVSENEAREALRLHFGNIWQAVSECIEQRQRKFRELSNRGNFSREDIVTALTTHHGNAEASMADLNKTQLSPFLMRIWGSPGGAENESGAKLQSKTESAPNGMDAADTAKAEDLPAVVTEESMPKDNKLDSANPPSTNATSNRLSRTEVEQSDNGLGGEEQVLPPKKTVPVPANITKELPQTQKQFLVKDAEEQRLPSVHPQSTTATNNVPIKTEEFTEERNLKSPIAEIETEPWQNSSQPTQDLTIIQKGPPDHQATTLSSYKSSDKIEIQDNSEALSQASTSTNGLIEKNTEQKTDFCGGDEQIPKIHASREDLTLTTTTQTNPVTKTLRDLANDDTDEISGSSSNPAQPFESTARNNGELPKRAASDGPLIDGAPTLARTQIKTSSKTNPSKIPKPKSTGFRVQKMPARSKSFSSPSPPQTGISSIKAIQKVFLNNQTPSKKSAEAKTLPTSIVKRKNAITAVISKLNQPAESSNNGNSSTSPSKLTGLSAPGFSRSRTQPRIPKKNYHETCFSDEDYRSSETTDLEEEEEEAYQGDETPEVRQRKQSVPVFRAYAAVQEPEVVNPEELSRQFLRDQLVSNEAEAQVAATLVGLRFQQDVSLWAAKECTDLEHAIALLQQECELCMGTRALNEMVSMLKCTHKCCKQCAKSYFTVQITDRSINDCNCPFCKMPELHGQNGQQEDENLEYFSNLDILLKNILDPAVHELFQRKLRDRTLLQDPNFKWCIQCSSGFFARPKQRRLICPDCGSVTCSQCRKTWEKQHEGLSCEQFLAWKEANDPEVQAQGVQQHLAQNGIDCPKCKFRYSLTRGGCMHFTCTQCKFEFCYGCSRAFMMGAKCKKSPYCSKLGLHAHHPRNCLFYLRDKLPVQLQFLLKENGVNYEVEALLKASNGGNETTNHKAGLCPIQIQKETPKGLVDTVCNGDITDKQAGLCRAHYVEYLTAIVAKAGIDPLPIFDLTDCVQELRRRGIPLPERGPWDTDEIYKNMCSEIIKEKIPLNSD